MEDTSFGRSVRVGLAMTTDVLFNFPLWIAAKRIGANLPPFPSDWRHLYRGGGTLWLSLGPTTMVEDKVTAVLNSHHSSSKRDGDGINFSGLLNAACSGMVAALLVTSQVEYIITASHSIGKPILSTLKGIYCSQGLKHILLPPGMAAMVGREIPFASALFFVRPVIYDTLSLQIENRNAGFAYELYHSAFCGILTSILATPISQAPSVVAAYQQGHHQSSCTTRQAINYIYSRFGWRGFFRGLTARTLSLAGTFTVVPLALKLIESVEKSLID